MTVDALLLISQNSSGKYDRARLRGAANLSFSQMLGTCTKIDLDVG